MMKPVCLNCEERYVGCHGSCERYIEAKNEHLENENQRKKDKWVRFSVGDEMARRVARKAQKENRKIRFK